MSRFNKVKTNINITENKEGVVAYKLSSEYELYSAVVTSALDNKFYEKSNERLDRIRLLIKSCSPKFVAKLAVYARESMYLRTIPLVLTIELNKHLNDANLDKTIIRKLSKRVIQRADEITEILGYYALANQRTEKNEAGQTKRLSKLSKSLQKGIADSFSKFNEYQFAKYNRKTEITLKDALFLTHPKPKDKNEENLYKKIAAGTLQTPKTWEVCLSTAKDKGQTKKQVWEDLIDSNSLGYMSLLRNLRNILQENVSKEHIFKVCKKLSDATEVKNSKQFPFRFLVAYRELGGRPLSKRRYSDYDVQEINNPYTSLVMDALEDAMLVSAENISGFNYDTNVMIASDVSGSMEHPISSKSKIELYDVGLTLSMLLQNRCKVVQTGIFGDTFKVKHLPKKSILANVMKMHEIEGEVGYSTNGYKVIDHLIKTNQIVNKVMIFTDCQMWNSNYSDSSFKTSWNQYKKISPKSKLYLFDLGGYGNTPINIVQNDVFLIAGWSDKIFDILASLENGDDAIKVINKIEL